MTPAWRGKLVLDTNCFVHASRGGGAAARFSEFCAHHAPRLYLSTVVAAELRAGVTTPRQRRVLDRHVLEPYVRRGRLVNPSPAAWDALGTTLGALIEREGLVLREVPRSFLFDVLIAWSCREIGAVLVSGNVKDLSRIRRVFSFDCVPPYPDVPEHI
jgi:predicted nucleic acid-binding protein